MLAVRAAAGAAMMEAVFVCMCACVCVCVCRVCIEGPRGGVVGVTDEVNRLDVIHSGRWKGSGPRGQSHVRGRVASSLGRAVKSGSWFSLGCKMVMTVQYYSR